MAFCLPALCAVWPCSLHLQYTVVLSTWTNFIAFFEFFSSNFFLFSPLSLSLSRALGSAIGFRLDSLLKIADTRARNKKTTLMHYLCKVQIAIYPWDMIIQYINLKIFLDHAVCLSCLNQFFSWILYWFEISVGIWSVYYVLGYIS